MTGLAVVWGGVCATSHSTSLWLADTVRRHGRTFFLPLTMKLSKGMMRLRLLALYRSWASSSETSLMGEEMAASHRSGMQGDPASLAGRKINRQYFIRYLQAYYINERLL